MKSIRRKAALALASTALLAPIGVQSIASTAEAMCPPDDPCPTQTPPTARDKIITRAQTWLAANNGNGVPYSQTKTLRRLPHRLLRLRHHGPRPRPSPGLNTVGPGAEHRRQPRASRWPSLQARATWSSTPIGTNTTRHVVIFEKWANSGAHLVLGRTSSAAATAPLTRSTRTASATTTTTRGAWTDSPDLPGVPALAQRRGQERSASGRLSARFHRMCGGYFS